MLRALAVARPVPPWTKGHGRTCPAANRHLPPGALAGVPLPVRLAALAGGFLGFLLIRRSAFAGVVVGEGLLVAGALVFS
jgi:hypothetical protein